MTFKWQFRSRIRITRNYALQNLHNSMMIKLVIFFCQILPVFGWSEIFLKSRRILLFALKNLNGNFTLHVGFPLITQKR